MTTSSPRESLAPPPPPVPRRRPAVLCILDGWGEADAAPDNGISAATTPNWNRLLASSPHTLIETSGLAVGLPAGQMGNSEVGHMNIGAGRVVMQDLPRIDRAIADGSLQTNAKLGDFIATLKRSSGRAHLLGLLSPGGVHSHQDHLAALARTIAAAGVPVLVHAFLDGRDTPPKSAGPYLNAFRARIGDQTGIRLATIAGRYFAMDRDQRWERVAQAFEAIVTGTGAAAADADAALASAYARGETDEFVTPTLVGGYDGMRAGDGILMGNFRADRAREILTALLDPAFSGFARPSLPKIAAAAGLVEYSAALNPFLASLFPPERLEQTLGALVAEAGLTQLRIAETEKYAHVTFFLNGGEEAVFPGEDRILIPSPKVATYDLKPEMAALEVTARLIEAIESRRYDLIVVNFANPDMVGHTGVLAAAIQAVEVIDSCLGRLAAAVETAGGVLLITADHGNIEQMSDAKTGQPHTAHTTNVVPVVVFNAPAGVGISPGRLADIAPTLLPFLGLKQPAAMTGHSLLTANMLSRART